MRQSSARLNTGQFGGLAMYSIIAGGLSVAIPIGSSIASHGSSSYVFFLLPFFGLWRGFMAFQRGQVLGGVLGMGLSSLGALLTLGLNFL